MALLSAVVAVLDDHHGVIHAVLSLCCAGIGLIAIHVDNYAALAFSFAALLIIACSNTIHVCISASYEGYSPVQAS